jgi:hypothetical protein
MQKQTYIVILAGIVLLMFSSLGLPVGFKNTVSVISILGIIILSILSYREQKHLLFLLGKGQKSKVSSFVDNSGTAPEKAE